MRNIFGRLNGGSGALAAAAVCLVLLAVGYWLQRPGDAPVAPQQSALQVPPADIPSATQEAAAPVAQETPAPPRAPAPPAFDEVRREADGMTVIAGRAAPGSEVKVLQNGVQIAQSTADVDGKFATLAIIPPDGLGHVLSLSQSVDGAEAVSQDEIILAPQTPVETAAAAPEVMEKAEDSGPADEAPLTQAEATEPATSPDQPTDTDSMQMAALTPSETTPTPEPPQPLLETTQAPSLPEDTSDTTPTAPQVMAIAPPATDVPQTSVPAETTAPAPPQAVAVLKSTAEGVELLNTPSPEAMTNVAIDTISYSGTGEVELAGRAQTNTASVRVYLDNAPVVNLLVDEQGRWRGELPNVDEGIYTLRVDEVSADGDVTSRVETPFKREDAQVLADAAAAQDGPIKAITVQKGATLWAIARDRYGDGQLYVRVFEANAASIRDPDLIYPGQIFDLPD